MRTTFRKLIILITVSYFFNFSFWSVFFAQDKNVPGAKMEIEKLTLFKNGLGFIISNAELPGNATTIKIGQLPIPSFGTFWVSYPNEVSMQSLITSLEDIESEVPVQSVGQMLLLNAGRKVIIHTADRDIEGMILESKLNKDPNITSNPFFMSPIQPHDSYNSYIPSQNLESRLVSIKTDKGIIVIDPSSVNRAEFIDSAPVNITHNRTKCPVIRMELEKPAGNKKVTISYLARGITWSPGYLIDLTDPKIAKFSAHAVILNEMMDFNNIKLQLTTGFPNIKFANVQSPVAKSQSLSDFLNALSGNNNSPVVIRGIASQQAMLSNSISYAEESDSKSLVPEYSTAQEGAAVEDLFFYPVDNFSLKKDETAWIPLFSAEMPYKHIYTWKIKNFIDANDYYRANDGTPENKSTEEIWHSCRLINNLKMPLTTAATEFISDGKLTGQDICYYTPPNTETTIRINKAMNVIAEQAEMEVERQRDAARFHGYQYDLVKVRGELKVHNKFDRAITMEISKELSGEILESLPKSKDIKTAKGLKQVNSLHNLTWELNLAPSSEGRISYTYQVYIRE